MSHARVFEWLRRFKEGGQSVNSDPGCSGRPRPLPQWDKIAQVKAVLHSDRCLTVREMPRSVTFPQI
ncbi:hypothetical protein TNCV_1032261 [Trichonephila clavipes]|nr:hypothetical protein TNCV_1032261 [Trichonephila clavipes]